MNRGQKQAYVRDYKRAKDDGKPFYPYAVYKDSVVAALAIAFVLILAVWQRVDVGDQVNPATTDYVPRPEWYFFFLFELLRIFKNQNALMPLIMATFIIPNILMALLILTPFIDRGPERRIHRRPIALTSGVAVTIFLAYMTYLGANAPEGGAGAEGLPLTSLDPEAEAGAQLFVENCTTCHMIKGVGAGGPGPDLSNGPPGRQVNPQTAEQFFNNPPAGMPNFSSFTPEQYKQLGTLLDGLKSGKYK